LENLIDVYVISTELSLEMKEQNLSLFEDIEKKPSAKAKKEFHSKFKTQKTMITGASELDNVEIVK
jgi:hypothetical protein